MDSYSNEVFPQTINQILDKIQHQGYGVIENAIPQNLIEQLYQDCLSNQSNFHSAGIGRQQDLKQDNKIRTDKTFWLKNNNQSQQTYLNLMNDIRLAVNRHFYLGLFDYESHFAKYDIGDFYKKHLDAFKGRSNRIFTTVCYLNTPMQGGELLIYSDISDEVIEKISPKAGTLIVFESERFAHEVLPTNDIRYSIAGWFRKNNSVAGIVDPAS
ncbi:2OG-Fe(II) oxygenase [Pseudoalteromonas denitrificans]|uniref:SM-20-related protein n=1 Tax=Pseudoalteromonas denitrificans DSM 6059 TaxID=1123010 RepID=A0A1I1DZ29_9GAMM|nr:2OG-Fe(II) oxygenase [Pseudoalteromonas denitrificans]SFB77980.1 SM-20-related protein [Pseudoalteromonas denitrificans DSM 6059]